MKRLISIFLILLAVAACRTPAELVNKALKKDPSILNSYTTKYDTLVKIDTIIKYKDTLYIPQYQTVFKFKIDTNKVDSVQTLYEDSKSKLEYWKDKAGKDNARLTCKGDTIIRFIQVPIYIEKLIPGKQGPKVTIIKKDFFWYLGLILTISIVGFGIFKLIRYFKVI